ncbi:MAG: hypothetical protein JRH07_04625 [Deltaproteobacteria bacterium]|nr:hypothetical protein [Deltaproteobacteria bacterium]MBW2121115.1 hypothetical protein [Deltaproteobacteria bacterium]
MDDSVRERPGMAEEEVREEEAIDLNTLFRDQGRDLNRLFPDPGSRRLLRDVRRNRRDVERFLKRLETDGPVTERSGGSNEVS